MGAPVWGFVWKAIVSTAISYATSAITNKLFGPKSKNTSPTYSFGALQTQTNSGMVMPMIYGSVKCAGNNIWASAPGTVQYRIVSFGVGKIKGFRDIRINDIPIEQLPGCSYTAYLGDGEQIIDSRVTGATQEDKAKLVGGLKYDAYLAITITASEKLSNVDNVTAIVDGRIVRVYTSTTVYTEQWSDNPAWCELDFKISVDGCGMDISSLDMQSYLTAANYYNELVNNKKRFTLNLILDEKKSRQDWLTEIFSTCRSYPTYQRGLHGVLVDKPETVSQIFNIKPDESIETWWQDNSEDIERLQIEYIDPNYEYAKVIASADRVQLAGEKSQFRNKSPLTKKISIYGITNFEQASREAWFHLNKAQTCPEWIQYTTNKRALNRSIGDVVGIWNPITEVTEPGLTYKRYRIMQMTEPQENKITMVMQEYNPNLYSDTMGSVAPTVNITKLDNPYSPPPSVEGLILSEYGWMNPDGTHVSCINLQWTALDYQYLSDYVVNISDDSGVTWRTVGNPTTSIHVISNVIAGKKYLVAVQARNRYGLLSNKSIAEITVAGKDSPPQDVTGFSVVQTGNNINFTWNKSAEPDIKNYEIRMGSSWVSSQLVAQVSSAPYLWSAPSNGTLNFWIKAIDNFGNYSAKGAEKSINIFGLASKNIILDFADAMDTAVIQGMYKTPSGTWEVQTKETIGSNAFFADMFNTTVTQVSNASIDLAPIDLGYGILDTSNYYANPWGNLNIKSQETIGSGVNFANMFSTTVTPVPAKAIAETYVTVNPKYNPRADNAIFVDYSVSLDNNNYSSKVQSLQKQFTGRYLRISLHPTGSQLHLKSTEVIVDVPDVEFTMENIPIGATKTHIAYPRKLLTAPSVALFVCDSVGQMAIWKTSNVTNNGFDLELFNLQGTAIAGTLVKAIIRGY